MQQSQSSYYNSQSQAGLLRHQRNLEMVMSGRHKFEVRDLEDSLKDVKVVPLALPKLPSAFEPSAATQIVPNGLIRQARNRQHQQENNHHNCREQETTQNTESINEEKLLIDSKCTEKNKKKRQIEEEEEPQAEEVEDRPTTESLTIKSINTSWSVAGESMAHESDLSSSAKKHGSMLQSNSEAVTLNASLTDTEQKSVMDTDTEVTLNDVKLDFSEFEKPIVETELEKIVNKCTESMLEDETSPSISLLTNSKESGREGEEQSAILDRDNSVEDQLEDTTEPAEFKSPIHTSNSNSLSEPGRDFLIDDEIADQPGLFSNYKNGKNIIVKVLYFVGILIPSISIPFL